MAGSGSFELHGKLPVKENTMLLLIILLVIIVLASGGGWYGGYYGPGPFGLLGAILFIVLILWLLGILR